MDTKVVKAGRFVGLYFVDSRVHLMRHLGFDPTQWFGKIVTTMQAELKCVWCGDTYRIGSTEFPSANDFACSDCCTSYLGDFELDYE